VPRDFGIYAHEFSHQAWGLSLLFVPTFLGCANSRFQGCFSISFGAKTSSGTCPDPSCFRFCHWATAEKEAIQSQLYAGSSHLIVGLFGRHPAKEFW